MIPAHPGPPLPADPAAAERAAARWARAGLGPIPDLLRGVFGSSPFLTELALAEPELVRAIVASGADAAMASVMDQLAGLDTGDRARLMSALRRLRRRWSLVIALADLAGDWPLERTTAVLSEVADQAVHLVVRHLLGEAAKRGEIAPELADRPEIESGMIVVAMGKHGARELNYSSDIDLIVLFDERRYHPRGAEPPMAHAVRLARTLAHMLEAKTAEGFVFRTDLRLRPHLPGHPLAISTDAAELYYERHGQNWERAALIKARAVAGDVEAGATFLREIAPFIWRNHLDYAAIRDIHSIKRQINAYRGFVGIKAAGHDLKVGRGGIREIEFFAQTQQLILGGRVPDLRVPETCEALRRLAERRWIEADTAQELTAAYRFLRTLEHRLQMVADRQTHALPEQHAGLAAIAAFAGFTGPDALESAVLATLRTVERHYAALFEREPDLGGGGSLVFTGTGDHPSTLETLAQMGFRDTAAVASRLRAWHHGHIRATRSTRARELLTELTPALLAGLQAQPDPAAAFRLFDEFLSGLPSGVQIFSLLRANPRLLTLLADLMGMAPRLARMLAARVDLLDAMLAPDFFESLPTGAALRDELARQLSNARHLEDTLDLTRRWAHGRQFQAGLQVLLGLVDAGTASRALTSIAETALQTMLATAERWLVAQHGNIADGRFAVLGMGKLGSRELSPGGDLDLVLVYDAPADSHSDGPRPLPAGTWFARLGQRLVSALSAPTAEGRLYEIDTRLRPSGSLGPVACSLENFRRYHEATAEVWEQQALTRARVIAGDAGLGRDVAAVIAEIITRPRDPRLLAAAVRAVRERIAREHGGDGPWRLKHARGGIVELEFLAQYLVLVAGDPSLVALSPGEVAQRSAERGLLGVETAAALAEASALFQSLQSVLRLSVDVQFDPALAPPRLIEALRRAAGLARAGPPLPDMATLEAAVAVSQRQVRHVFDDLCPAVEAADGGRSNDGERR